MTFLDQLGIVSEEERQKDRPYMRSVLIGVGKYYDLAVFQVLYVEAVLEPAAESRYERSELLVRKDLFQPLFLDVERLAS